MERLKSPTPARSREPVGHTCQWQCQSHPLCSCMLIILKLTKSHIRWQHSLQWWVLSHSHPHVAELAEVKSLHQGKVFEMDKLKQEMDKLKQKLEERHTSVAKVWSLLVVLLTMSSFHRQVGISSANVFSPLFQWRYQLPLTMQQFKPTIYQQLKVCLSSYTHAHTACMLVG